MSMSFFFPFKVIRIAPIAPNFAITSTMLFPFPGIRMMHNSSAARGGVEPRHSSPSNHNPLETWIIMITCHYLVIYCTEYSIDPDPSHHGSLGAIPSCIIVQYIYVLYIYLL
ncbi:hypothetical protein K504DRAFT_255643 [Pleomassaria siparia CBS 279.74]|uniref:Uncharacterized protein n=1 Tax=Pleomassaria siparia CBS 279.74 TaxID=1314801 RepID=A0A6G1KBM1_9PLEO|nr:hypothetical protein K504DRAFT_255643 [Pleomassaria siparia CBS 279.74]